MPLYEYGCKCGAWEEVFRVVELRDDPMFCTGCRRAMTRSLSVPHVRFPERPDAFWRRDRDKGGSPGPAVHVWDSDRKFPNLRKEGDGTMSFPTKAAYKAYLKQENIQELSTEAKLDKPRGNVTVAK